MTHKRAKDFFGRYATNQHAAAVIRLMTYRDIHVLHRTIGSTWGEYKFIRDNGSVVAIEPVLNLYPGDDLKNYQTSMAIGYTRVMRKFGINERDSLEMLDFHAI